MLRGYHVVTPKDMGLMFDVEENGETFYDNALIKARALYELCGLPTLADDSGLCVCALDGAPGVFSARYSGGSDSDNIDKLLNALSGAVDRTAYFQCTVVYYGGAENIVSAEGRAYGKIALSRRGENGFGYDPIFISDDLGKTFAEADESEKNTISHRARALLRLREKLGVK